MIWWPPSAPIRLAIRPCCQARSTSSTVVARASWSAYRRIMVWPPSICSSVAVTAASPVSVAGTNTDQNWAPTPPARSRGRSVCVPSRLADVGVGQLEPVEVVADLLPRRPEQVVVPVARCSAARIEPAAALRARDQLVAVAVAVSAS